MGSSNLGGQMGSTSSSHSRLISRSNSSVGVGNQRLNVQVEGSGIASSSHNGGSSHRGSNNRGSVDLATTGSKVVSTGSSHSRLISRDHSSIGVANQVGVQIERSSISVSNNRGSGSNHRGSSSNDRGSNNRGSGSNHRGSSSNDR